MLYSAVYYPANYGFIPRTFCDDGDPLDALVLGQEPVHPLTVVDARAIGVMRMRDEKGIDDKILAVSVNDPAFVDYTTHTQLPAHALREIRRFFQDYKTLENKQVVVEDFMGPEDAVRILEEALDLYRKLRRGEVDRRKSMSPAPMLFATYPLWFNVTTVVVFADRRRVSRGATGRASGTARRTGARRARLERDPRGPALAAPLRLVRAIVFLLVGRRAGVPGD